MRVGLKKLVDKIENLCQQQWKYIVTMYLQASCLFVIVLGVNVQQRSNSNWLQRCAWCIRSYLKMGKSGIPWWQCVKPWLFGQSMYLGIKLIKCVIYRRKSYPDKVGHWRCSVALEVLPGRVSAWLRKEPTSTFGKSNTASLSISEPLGDGRRDRGCPKRQQAMRWRLLSTEYKPDSQTNQLICDV